MIISKNMKNTVRVLWAVMSVALFTGIVSCQKEPGTEPQIRVSQTEISIDGQGGESKIVYSIENEVEGKSVEVKNDASWLSIDTGQARVINLSAKRNDSGDQRSTEIEINYPGAKPVNVKVIQGTWDAPIALTILNTEDVKVTFSVATKDPDLTWTGQIVAKEWYDAMTSDDEIFQADLEYYLDEARWNNQTLEEYIATILNKGSYDSLTFGGLDPQSEYVVYVYGMSPKGERTTDIYTANTKTLDPYQGPITFELSARVENHIVYAQFIPDHEGVPFWADIMTKADLDAASLSATDEAGKIKEYAQSLIESQISRYLALDVVANRKEYVDMMSYNYSVTDFNYEGYPNTEYIIYACKMDDDAKLVGDLVFEHVTTEAVEQSDNKITVTLGDVTQTTVEMEVTTTNDDPYIIYPIETKWIENCTTDQEIYEAAVENAGSVWNLEYYMCWESLYGRMSYLTPGTDHTLLVFGYTANTLTTPIQKYPFRTLDAGDPDDCDFEFIISTIKAREIEVLVRPSDTSVKYYWDVFETDATTEDVIAKIEEIKRSMYDGYQEFQRFVTYLEDDVILSGLYPSYSYKLGAIPVNCYEDENGVWQVDILGDAVFSEVFTTKESKVADITITVGCEKYYDGDVLANAVPDRYGAWEGYAYVHTTATVVGEYERYRYSVLDYEEGLEDPAVFSDAIIVQTLEKIGVDDDAKFRCLWDVPQMYAAVAVDYDGNYSPVFREVVTFTRDGVSPAEDILGPSTKSDFKVEFLYSMEPVTPNAVKTAKPNDKVKEFNKIR